MKIPIYVVIGLLIGMPFEKAWAATPTNERTTNLLNAYRADNAQLGMLRQSLGGNNPQVLEQQSRVTFMAEQLISEANARQKNTEEDYEALDQKVREAEQALRGTTGRTDVSINSLEAVVESLDKDREALMLESFASKARQSAIEDAVHSQMVQSQELTTNDPVSQEIQKEIDALAERLQLIQQSADKGLNAPADVTAAKVALAEAKTKLAERHDTVVTEAGGSLLTDLNHELVDAGIADSERKAKLLFIDQRLESLGNALQIAEDRDLANLLPRRSAAQAAAEDAARDAQIIHGEVAAPSTQPAK